MARNLGSFCLRGAKTPDRSDLRLRALRASEGGKRPYPAGTGRKRGSRKERKAGTGQARPRERNRKAERGGSGRNKRQEQGRRGPKNGTRREGGQSDVRSVLTARKGLRPGASELGQGFRKEQGRRLRRSGRPGERPKKGASKRRLRAERADHRPERAERGRIVERRNFAKRGQNGCLFGRNSV